jgi:hypothetical protein
MPHLLIPILKSFRKAKNANEKQLEKFYADLTKANAISMIAQEYSLIIDKKSTLPSQYRNQVVFIMQGLDKSSLEIKN